MHPVYIVDKAENFQKKMEAHDPNSISGIEERSPVIFGVRLQTTRIRTSRQIKTLNREANIRCRNCIQLLKLIRTRTRKHGSQAFLVDRCHRAFEQFPGKKSWIQGIISKTVKDGTRQKSRC
jgi:hypothetical protein